jgi:hypothetical protein
MSYGDGAEAEIAFCVYPERLPRREGVSRDTPRLGSSRANQ